MELVFSFLLVFGVVLLAVASFGKQRLRSEKAPFGLIIRYFGYWRDVKIAYLILIFLSVILTIGLISLFPEI
jgi:hypothetical protein